MLRSMRWAFIRVGFMISFRNRLLGFTHERAPRLLRVPFARWDAPA